MAYVTRRKMWLDTAGGCLCASPPCMIELDQSFLVKLNHSAPALRQARRFRSCHNVVPQRVQSVVVLFDGIVAFAPPVTFEFAYQVYAGGKYFKPTRQQVGFHARYAGEHVLAHLWRKGQTALVKQLRAALSIYPDSLPAPSLCQFSLSARSRICRAW